MAYTSRLPTFALMAYASLYGADAAKVRAVYEHTQKSGSSAAIQLDNKSLGARCINTEDRSKTNTNIVEKVRYCSFNLNNQKKLAIRGSVSLSVASDGYIEVMTTVPESGRTDEIHVERAFAIRIVNGKREVREVPLFSRPDLYHLTCENLGIWVNRMYRKIAPAK